MDERNEPRGHGTHSVDRKIGDPPPALVNPNPPNSHLYDDYDDEEEEHEEHLYQGPDLPEIPDEIVLSPEIKAVTIQLSSEQGAIIRELIQEHYVHTMPNYCRKVGIVTPNFYNTVNGERPCTLEWLRKLLSGIGFEVELSSPEIVIREVQTGQIVPDVDSIIQEGESQLREQEGQDTPDSSS